MQVEKGESIRGATFEEVAEGIKIYHEVAETGYMISRSQGAGLAVWSAVFWVFILGIAWATTGWESAAYFVASVIQLLCLVHGIYLCFRSHTRLRNERLRWRKLNRYLFPKGKEDVCL